MGKKNPLEKITVLNRYSPNTGVLKFKRANSITYEDSDKSNTTIVTSIPIPTIKQMEQSEKQMKKKKPWN